MSYTLKRSVYSPHLLRQELRQSIYPSSKICSKCITRSLEEDVDTIDTQYAEPLKHRKFGDEREVHEKEASWKDQGKVDDIYIYIYIYTHTHNIYCTSQRTMGRRYFMSTFTYSYEPKASENTSMRVKWHPHIVQVQ